ncbi:efflux RND transporter periplasmic adaptor subunit [Vibrio hippocampi]|uniref:Multidrug resistance protein MdtA n=1 Tax=Vibrio hippocampi TaxID=654686 RepID=A0ABM8ZFI4_9VIBR|nr:efflux RND transporter periplasmic adaptor subunit [Vibrio hippocampi]CAH0525284.1 Multidrug resistance protein MdtA [Vibrio hippocampi]
MKKTTLTALLSLALVSVSPVSFSAGKAGPQSVSVVTDKVGIHQVSQSLSLIGKLESDQSVILASEVSGIVNDIKVTENQQVTRGQLLVLLNDDKALASVAEAQSYLKDQKRILAEFERLVDRNAITKTEIDAQRSSVEIAQARLDSANASLSDLYITAPFDGTVGLIDFSRGKLVNVGTELLTLDDLEVMQLDLQVPEHYLPMLEKGMEVTARTSAWGERLFTGKVMAIDTRVNQETLNLRVRIHFPNTDNKLKPGMLAQARMVFPPIEAAIIPVQALEYSGTKRFVYVVDSNNKANKTEVFLGARVGNEVVIEKGINIGDRIVIQGTVNMRDGISVKEVEGEPTATINKPLILSSDSGAEERS